MRTVPSIASLILSGISLCASVYLVVIELQRSPFCPPVLGIPACYLVTVSYALVLWSIVFHHSHFSSMLFWIGSIAGVSMAIWFSANQLLGAAHCPIILGIPIPLCYASLVAFITLILLHIAKEKPHSQTQL